MAKEYKSLLGAILIGILCYSTRNFDLLGYQVCFSITILCSLYRHSTLYQKYRFKDDRFFIKSKYDTAYTSQQLYVGVICIVLAAVLYVFDSSLPLDRNFIDLIFFTLAVHGSTSLISKLFLSPHPVIELALGHTVDVIKDGKLLSELYDLKDFELKSDQIILESAKEKIELDGLELSREQASELRAKLNEWLTLSNKEKEIRKNAVSKMKRYFTLKKR